MPSPLDRRRNRNLRIGTRVEVRGRYTGSWSAGFEIVDTTENGYWLRRDSDQYRLPTPFVSNDVRRRS